MPLWLKDLLLFVGNLFAYVWINVVLSLVKITIWPVATVLGLYWVAKPLAEGASGWMSKASPDKFLESLFSIPTAIVVVVFLVGVKRIRNWLDTIIERGFEFQGMKVNPRSTAGPVEMPEIPPKGVQ